MQVPATPLHATPLHLSSNSEAPKPLSIWKRVGIFLAGVLTFVLTLVSSMLPIAVIATWKSSPWWPSLLLLILTVSVTVGLGWLLFRLNSLLKPAEPNVPRRCQCCGGDVPTIKTGLHRHIGAIVFMFHKSSNGYLCKACIKKLFWEYTPVTFFCGWWGIASLVITPIVLINNIIAYLKSRALEVPVGMPDSALASATPPGVVPTTRVI